MYKLTLLTLTFIFLFFIGSAQNWEEQAEGLLPDGYGVFSISVVDDMTVWAMAYDQNVGNMIPDDHICKVLKTTDGGASWQAYDVDEAIGRISFDIAARSADVAYISTFDFNDGNNRGIFKTEDGGESWTSIYDGETGGIWIKFFNDLEGITINRGAMATTNDGGDTWTEIPSENIPTFANDEFTIIRNGSNSCVVLGDHIWFGTSKGRIFHSPDKGQSWTASTTSLGENAILVSVAFRDSLNGITLSSSAFATQFSVTYDGGDTWTSQGSTSNILVDNLINVPGTDSTLVAISSQFITGDNNRVSAYSKDFGITWETIQQNVPYGATQFIAGNVGWSSRGRIFSEDQSTLYKWSNDFFVSTEDLLQKSTKVYPNPFFDQLNVETPQATQYRLLDNTGRVLKTGLIEQQSSINYLSDLSAGIYYLHLDNGQQQVTHQLIKPN